jgi:hypothetical protein
MCTNDRGEGNAGPRWQDQRVPVEGRRRGRERGAFEVLGPMGADVGGGGRR